LNIYYSLKLFLIKINCNNSKNEEKYRKATKDYISISIFTFKKMNEFLDLAYNLVNPIMLKVYYINMKSKLSNSNLDNGRRKKVF